MSSIDTPPKPKVDVQESIANAKVYCKQYPEAPPTIGTSPSSFLMKRWSSPPGASHHACDGCTIRAPITQA